ncbi:MAG: hypothetical protein WEE64_06460 [Dehalococcoidia bacterium]
MNIDALPQTLLLILAEFSVGSLIAVLIADARAMVPSSFVKLSAVIIVAGAALALLVAFSVNGVEIAGYNLADGLLGPIQAVLVAFATIVMVYAWLVLSNSRDLSLRIGVIGAAAGLVALGLLAYQVSPPAWSVAGTLTSLLVGALALGLVTEAMVLGHWYLVSPKLPGRPLQELTFLLLAVLCLQAVVLIVNASIPAREAPDSAALLAGTLGSNPAFWLRVGVGLIFPIALAYMAWRSSKENAMMSATGLLYIAVGAVFVGELLARGLLFVTAAPV